MRRGRVLNLVIAGVGLVALAACGDGVDYQYLEVPDGQTFAKLPVGWTIDSEGWTDFRFVDANALNTAFVPGDNPIAWRATFNGEANGSLPAGVVSVQSIAVGDRSSLLIGPLIDPVAGTEEVSRAKVQLGELEGWRARQEGELDGENWVAEQMILTDPRRSTLYYLRIMCTEQCHDRYAEEIDEVLTTFRVEL